jgi:uncharacterized membrane protein YhaH (DUF805 family)
MHWYFNVLRNYVTFKGRARRKEFWMFTLIHVIVTMALNFVDRGLLVAGSPVFGVSTLYGLGTFLPELAVRVRRLHDTDRSGWWIFLLWTPQLLGIAAAVLMLSDSDGSSGNNMMGLLVLVLVVSLAGAVAFLVFMCLDGTRGRNRFGPDPKGIDGDEADGNVWPDIA